jgi:hypothetical protein
LSGSAMVYFEHRWPRTRLRSPPPNRRRHRRAPFRRRRPGSIVSLRARSSPSPGPAARTIMAEQPANPPPQPASAIPTPTPRLDVVQKAGTPPPPPPDIRPEAVAAPATLAPASSAASCPVSITGHGNSAGRFVFPPTFTPRQSSIKANPNQDGRPSGLPVERIREILEYSCGANAASYRAPIGLHAQPS